MRILLLAFSTVVLGASATSGETVKEYTSMSVMEQFLFSTVAETCQSYVEQSCSLRIGSFPFGNTRELEGAHSLGETEYESNSINQQQDLEGVVPTFLFDDFHREALNDLNSFVDVFLRPLGPEWVVVYDSRLDNGVKNPCPFHVESQVASGDDSRDLHVDNMIHSIASNVEWSEMDHVTNRLQEHGTSLLHSDGDNLKLAQTGRRFARRLQTLSAEEMVSIKHSFLPFSMKESLCLESASALALTADCARALHDLKRHRQNEYFSKREQSRQETGIYSDISVLYVFSFLTLILLVWRHRGQMKRNIRLQERILTAIYSTPALKRQVELKMGESAGHVPPLHPLILKRRGYNGVDFKRRLKSIRMFNRYTLAVIVLGILYAPVTLVKIAALLSIFYFVVVAAGITKSSEPICTCCCCKMSTEDLKNGIAPTKEQECCGCCQGTGVCSPQCASCCDPTEEGPGESKSFLCCGKKIEDDCDCCCADDEKKSSKNPMVENTYVYDGRPIQVV